MKKSTIWILGIIMGLSFLTLLYMQVSYIEEMVKMRREQFDESVQRGLDQACRNIELAETRKYLEADAEATERAAQMAKDKDTAENAHVNDDEIYQYTQSYSISSAGGMNRFEWKMRIEPNVPKPIISTGKNIPQTSRTLREILNDRYVHQRALLNEVIYNILHTASDKPLKERVNFKQLDAELKAELRNNGITIPYHFSVTDRMGALIYHCSDYVPDGNEMLYSHVLFKNDPPQRMGLVNIHFPTMNSYIFSSVRFMIPSVVFTFVLLVTFIFTIYIIFRQKKLTEIKNDFINNMTHELKTPISSISLAAQMLGDESVTKSPTMMKHLSTVIGDESRRLRFLVEKVLQMSMFDRKSTSFKKKELDLNELLEQTAATFNLRVEHTGGKINTEIEAVDSAIFVDEVHFQNAITNLLDNAVKYRKADQPVNIHIRTWNEGEHLCFSISDDGQGIKKENVKKVFDKFYRVHTGNVHDVKGFGLGLAYVKEIINLHDGEIKCESELGKGTKFTVKLPILQEN